MPITVKEDQMLNCWLCGCDVFNRNMDASLPLPETADRAVRGEELPCLLL